MSAGQIERLGGVPLAGSGQAASGLQPGQSRQRGRELGALTQLPRQRGGLRVVDFRAVPPITRRLVPGDVEQQVRKLADRRSSPPGPDHLSHQVATGVGVPQEQRSDHRPGRQRRIRTGPLRAEPLQPVPDQSAAVLAGQQPSAACGDGSAGSGLRRSTVQQSFDVGRHP